MDVDVKEEQLSKALAEAFSGYKVRHALEEVVAEELQKLTKAVLTENRELIATALDKELKRAIGYLSKSFVKQLKDNW
jgi:uncharacterized membrane protein YheB (UPF0754 family)